MARFSAKGVKVRIRIFSFNITLFRLCGIRLALVKPP